MGLNAIIEFGQRDADVTRITGNAARLPRRTLIHAFTKAEKQRNLAQVQTLTAWRMQVSFLDSFEFEARGMHPSEWCIPRSEC
jgi:hypothetical protein